MKILALLAILLTSTITQTTYAKDITIHTGSKTGTYFRFGNDLQNILEDTDITINVKNSTGSIENIKALSASNKKDIHFAIVQSDVLGFLKRSRSEAAQEISQKLNLVFPFYKEEVHILTGRYIKNLNDLTEKTVAIGAVGSGSWLTANNIFKLADITPKNILRLAPEESILAVLSGRADAAIIVAGKPVRLFKNLDELAKNDKYSKMIRKVKLLDITNDEVLKEYDPAIIEGRTYNFIKADVNTISVTSMLVSYDQDTGKKCGVIAKFANLLRKKIQNLQTFGHKKWIEVELSAEAAGWERNKCSSQKPDITNFENELIKAF